MSELSRERRIADAFVSVADTLTADYDIIDLLHTLVDVCVDLLDVDAGGILIADDLGDLQLVASTSEQAEFVEVMQLNAGNGPCVDSFKTGSPSPWMTSRPRGHRGPSFGRLQLSRASVRCLPPRCGSAVTLSGP